MPNEGLDVYKDRLETCKIDCETSEIDPQSISNTSTSALSTSPVSKRRSTKFPTTRIYLDKDFAYIERKLLDAEGLTVKRIREMHEPGTATVAAAQRLLRLLHLIRPHPRRLTLLLPVVVITSNK